MPSKVDADTYEFVTSYARDNGGQAPSYATVAAEVEGFEYVPGVSDQFEYLARQIKDFTAQNMILQWFDGGEFQRKLNEMPPQKFIDEYLLPAAQAVKMGTRVRDSVGTDIKTDAPKFLAEYERRKAGESFRVWKSKYSAVGEYVSGNLYTVFGKSGRGKSVTTLEDAIYAAVQGANVLVWSLEMGWYELLVRIYVSMSGEMGVATEKLNGIDMSVGFDSRDVRLGGLSDEFETAFRFFIETMNDRLDGNITVRCVDDEDFSDRSLRALESDIKQVGADYVVVDPFYYLDYEKNTSKTTGGDASNTSMLLRRLVGRLSVVCIAITQADETDTAEDEDGERELSLPERKDVKKTKSLLEDAAKLIGVDSDYKQGRALIGVFKGRDGGEGNTSDLLYMPQFGIVKEAETGEAVASEFNF